ncbi:MAG: sulfotransferase domain-containing protein [Geodermatophilaceae bacterium]|nr:sulfotransferase domain-containing protein [Geodermatophilaceae bacterium]MDQ3477370.1 sulfotransferase [Actinomycetota bacterium]
MSLANVYLVGAPKCGTTSLSRWLADHRSVYLSVPKESYYWAADYPRMRAHYGFDSRAAYEALYAGPQAQAARLRVDGSTTYLYSETAVPDITSAVTQPRFVVALRNPVDLLISWHRTQLITLNETETDFAAAWHRSLDGGLPDTDPLDPKLLDYPMIGGLGAAVDRLLDAVPRESVHVVLFDDLARDPGRTWRELTAFLGIDALPQPSFDVHNASNKTYRSAILRRLTHRPPAVLEAPVRRLRQWSRTTSNPLAAAVKERMWRSTANPRVSEEIRAELAVYFASDIDRLAARLQLDLSGWTTSGRQTSGWKT